MKKSRLESLAVLAAIALAWQRFGLGLTFLAPGRGGQVADTPAALKCDPGFVPKQVSGVWRCVSVEFGR